MSRSTLWRDAHFTLTADVNKRLSDRKATHNPSHEANVVFHCKTHCKKVLP